jgi:hypothetical protein
MLKDIKTPTLVDPSFICITDSSWGDCDDRKSTGCYIILVQGGIVDHSSFVPNPITLSSAEAEINAMTIGAMATNYIRQVYCHVMFNDPSRPFTVPMFTDSSSGIFITQNERDTKRTRHIERRWLFIRSCRKNGYIAMYFIPGDKYNISDLGTKNCSSPGSSYKLSIIEVPVSDSAIQTSSGP